MNSNPERMLNYLTESFNFLVDEWGMQLTKKIVGPYGPKLNYWSAQFSIEINYDMRDKKLELIKLLLDNENEVINSIFLASLLKGKGLHYARQVLSPSNFDELKIAAPEWKKILNTNKNRIVANDFKED